MRVAVTGGDGFIGRATVARLQTVGHTTVVVDRTRGHDVRSANDMTRALADCDAVIHLAGVLGTAELFDTPHEAVRANVDGTLNVLHRCEKQGMAYVSIGMPSCWPNVYQATKGCARTLAAAWHLHKGVPVSHVRAFNAFGLGQKVNGVQKIVPTFAARAWSDHPIPIWGDGRQTVDLVHVDHIAQMLTDALCFGNDDVFDAGTGVPMTVNDVADMVLRITGSTAGVEHLPMRLGEHPVDIAAEGVGWDKLGWKPEFRYSDFVDTVQWYQTERP